MKQVTAVQMLIEHIKRHGFDLEYEMEMSFIDHEKEQIMNAYEQGIMDDDGYGGCISNSEKYYNETYGN